MVGLEHGFLPYISTPVAQNGKIRIGIVGCRGDKFTPETEVKAKAIIQGLLARPGVVLVSGHCPYGGVDIWAEEIAKSLGHQLDIKTPKQNCWDGEYGYRARNLDIARSSDEIHVIVVADYPPGYRGQRTQGCPHCNTTSHIKSGGCWTAKQAQLMGKKAEWHIV